MRWYKLILFLNLIINCQPNEISHSSIKPNNTCLGGMQILPAKISNYYKKDDKLIVYKIIYITIIYLTLYILIQFI